MKVLVIGGTNFIGPHVVAELLTGGHDVTVFNRGKTGDSLPDAVIRLRGDRVEGEVDMLRGQSFDATIDMCGYFPRAMHSVFDALEEPGYYCYISTISVYASFAEFDQDESAPLATIEDPTSEEVTAHYGALKALCEDVVRTRAAQCSALRLGLVVGPGDVTDRFTYWPVRSGLGGTMIAPGPPDSLMQWIDARDIAGFARRCIEHRIEGTFNLATPPRQHTIGEVLEVAREVTGADVRHLWLNADELAEHAIEPWKDVPAWMPPNGEYAGFATFDTSAAMLAGLAYRPLKITMKDLVEWWSGQGKDRRQLRTGLGREREDEIAEGYVKKRPIVRVWNPGDEVAVRGLVVDAFDQTDESDLVDQLRAHPVETMEYVALQGDEVVGHVMFSRLEASPNGLSAWSLAPLSVAPAWQNRGIGQLLTRVGIEACRARGADLICVLGSPEYYQRFGFSWQLGRKVRSPYADVGTMWMVLDLTPAAAERVDEVVYASPFSELA